MTETQMPIFWKAAEREARRRSTTAREVLKEDLQGMLASSYPGPDCLAPYEVELSIQKGAEGLPAGRAAHVKDCPSCTALLEAAEPKTEGFEKLKQVLEEVRGLTVAAVAVAESAEDTVEHAPATAER